jgi:hypothetical protein
MEAPEAEEPYPADGILAVVAVEVADREETSPL